METREEKRYEFNFLKEKSACSTSLIGGRSYLVIITDAEKKLQVLQQLNISSNTQLANISYLIRTSNLIFISNKYISYRQS